MKIVIDDKIPYIRGVFEPFAEVVYLPGSKTTPETVRDADALITRTRTICNEALLAGSAVKFIATATIGFDHIDTAYCKAAGIAWTNAPGCNAGSVEQYIAAALFTWAAKRNRHLAETTIGIVGVGNVGKKVEKIGRLLGMQVLLNDPPREREEGLDTFVTLETICQNADIITFHVPLNMEGRDATWHMVDETFPGRLLKKPLLINSCRGEVFDTIAVINAIERNDISDVILDCWENEPDIHPGLMDKALLATPHIAGYSRDGKANGTLMSVRAVSRFFGLGLDQWEPAGVELPPEPLISLDGSDASGKIRSEESLLRDAVLATYNITADDTNLRRNPSLFEKWRGDYPVRREFTAYTLRCTNVHEETICKLREMGFRFNS